MKRLHFPLSLLLALLLASGAWLPVRSAAAPSPAGADSTVRQAAESQVATLVAADGEWQDELGIAVSVSGDTAVVGAHQAEVSANYRQGAAYVFERDAGGPGEWGQVAKLTAADGTSYDAFGVSAAIDGETIVVGAKDAGDTGAAYIFERDAGGPGAWGQVAKLTASDGVAGDQFGVSAALQGDTVIVGASYATVNGDYGSGAAYVFYRDHGGPGAWGQVTKMAAADGAVGDQFGISVAVDGGTAIVGASFAAVGGQTERGAAYVFYRDQGGPDGWGQVRKLTASDGEGYDYLGTSVALDGDTAAVGAIGAGTGNDGNMGAAYLYERNAGGANGWGWVARLSGEDGAAGNYAGYGVAVSGDRVLVGAPYAGGHGAPGQGVAYLFDRNQGGAGAWGQVDEFWAADAGQHDRLGTSVAAWGDTYLAGAPHAEVGGVPDQGAAYVHLVLDREVFFPLMPGGWSAVLEAPALYGIDNPDRHANYTVEWSSVPRAWAYTLEEDDNNGFASPYVTYSGPATSAFLEEKPAGTYYYRVRATNTWTKSPWSNVRSTTVNQWGWLPVVDTDFEGDFPGAWIVYDFDGSDHGSYAWGARDCRAYAGSQSGWAVGAGANGSLLACGSDYPDYADSWMVFGPFSLEGASAAELTFQLWLYSESGYDGVGRLASVDGGIFYGTWTSGDSGGWIPRTLDLSNVPTLGNLVGKPQVWVALVFFSDEIYHFAEGAHVDDVVVRKYVGPGQAPGPGALPALPAGVVEGPIEQSIGR